MANTKSTQHEIDLTSELNLNKFKADIKAYNGFNERNAPYYGGCLSPLYIKEDGQYSSTDKIYRGHLYSMNNGIVYKDGEAIMNVSGKSSFKKTVYRDSDCLDYLGFNGDENNSAVYKVRKIRNGIEITMGSTSSVYTIENATYDNSRFVVDWNNHVTFLIIGYTLSNQLYVKLYVHKWGPQNNGDPWPTLGVEEIDAVAFPSKLPKWIIDDHKIVADYDYEFESYTLSFTYNGAAFNYYPKYQQRLYLVTSYETTFNRFSYVDANNVIHPEADYTYTYTYSTGKVEVKGSYRTDRLDPTSEVTFSDTFYSFESFAKSQYSYNIRVSTSNLSGTSIYVLKEHGYDENQNRVDKAFLRFEGISSVYNNINHQDNEEINYEDSLDCGKIFTYQELRQNGLGYFSATSLVKTKQESKLCYVGSLDVNIPVIQSVKPTNEYTYPVSSVGSGDSELFVPAGRQCKEIPNSHFRILGTNTGVVQGVSYTSKEMVDTGIVLGVSYTNKEMLDIYDKNNRRDIGTLLCSWGAIDGTKNVYLSVPSPESISTITFLDGVTYYDLDEEAWVTITIDDNVNNNFTIIGDYIVINTTDYYNCVNINTGKKKHWASDWNNRFTSKTTFKYVSGYSFAYKSSDYNTVLVSTAQNTNWLSDNISSAVFPPEITLFYKDASITLEGINANVPDSNKVELYYDYKYVRNLDGSYNTSLDGTTYPSGETRYNIPLLFDVNNNLYNLITVNFGSSSFVIMYYDNKPRYQYFASSIATFDIIFVIQGQVYGIYDNKIYSITYGQNTIQGTNLIIPIDGLQYIGSTIYNAYFYSPTIKAIYQFGADNNLTIFAQADTFDEILGASYIPNTGSIIIGVKEGDNNYYTYVLNERFGIYRIKGIGAVTNAGWMEETNAILCFAEDANAYELSYEAMEGFEKKNIILDTSFYGAGSNVVSVNDCWYIRITDPEHGEGEVKVSVSTLTDVGRTTESITKPIKKNMWDDVTDTYYIRFQPKLQRAVGVSLHIESPFKIGYIGVGATPETLQLSKGSI